MLRILSYNIHKGFSAGNRRFVLSQMKEAIRLTGADIVFLQEVVGDHAAHRIENWPTAAQFEFLADEIWPHFAYGKNSVYDAGHHGNAILSRYPISSFENIDISHGRYESRGMLHAVVEVPEYAAPLHCISTHFGLFNRGRKTQALKLCERIQLSVSPLHPLVICGDMNDWACRLDGVFEGASAVTEVFRHTGGDYPKTFPTWLPILALDRVYVRGFEIIESSVLRGEPWTQMSDHLPLAATIKFKQ